jgi:putative hydrolase of the HAD superfamily
VDSTVAVERWFAELVEQRGLGADALAVLREQADSPTTPDESFQAIITYCGFADTVQQLQQLFRERVPLLARPVDGVMAGLQALRQSGWRTAILTNGTALTQLPKLRDGLADLIDVVCFADDEAASKPDPSVFRLLAERAGELLDGAWMIGDSLPNDIDGAAAVGMSTMWVSNGRPLPDGASKPDVIVSSARDAFPILLRLSGTPAPQ